MTSEMRPHGQDPDWSEAFWSRVAASDSDRSLNQDLDGDRLEQDYLDQDSDPAITESWGSGSPIGLEQFELLSAYLDDEVTPEERQQVETWLATDSAVQQVFRTMGGLSRSITQIPVPAAAPIEQTVQGVLAKLDRRKQRLQWVGGSAIAAVVTAALASISTGWQEPSWQMASYRSTPEQSLALSSQSPTLAPTEPAASPTGQTPRSVVDRALIIE